MRPGLISTMVAAILIAAAFVASGTSIPNTPSESPQDSGHNIQQVLIDTIIPEEDLAIRYSGLSDEDFKIVADRLGVEVAAMKAVVAVEAGHDMKGFWAPGFPVVNCDKSLWKTCSKYVKQLRKDPPSTVVPAEIPAGFPRRAWQKLIDARKQNRELADLCTFWGMFQIGGFNYAICGCKSIDEFVYLQSYSELQQLEIFATLIENSGLTKYLKNRNWAGFASKYNGSSYARRGYHTKMANAYNKYKK